MNIRQPRLLAAAILVLIVVPSVGGWLFLVGGDWHGLAKSLGTVPANLRQLLARPAMPPGFAMSNGRLEAREVDVATRIAGRLTEVRVREGDRVEQGQVLALIDTDALLAQERVARAQKRQAEQEREQALAQVEQGRSELDLSRRELTRLKKLFGQAKFVSEEDIDKAATKARTEEAALAATRVGVLVAEAAIEAAQANLERIAVDIADASLKAPSGGRVLYRLAEPGEVLAVGGKVLTLLDLTDVYMVIYLPTPEVGRLRLGAPARLAFGPGPPYARVAPASVSFVSPRSQFTPKEVETQDVRQLLAFRVKVQIDPELLASEGDLVKTGVPGVAYVQLEPTATWPDWLATQSFTPATGP